MWKIPDSFNLNQKVFFLLVFTFIPLLGCGSKDEEATESAVDAAKVYLTEGECQKAIDILEEHRTSNTETNAEFVKTHASAYGCRAGYSEIDFFANDVASIGSASGGLFNAFANFSSSNIKSADDVSYTDLQVAIDILLYSGNISAPSANNRAQRFSEQDAQDINAMLLYMLTVQLGKYAYYFGNANTSDGTKGGSNNGNGNVNDCYYDYGAAGDTPYDAIATLSTGDCDEAYLDTSALFLGHPDFSGGGTTAVRRLCQGVVLWNNYLDVIVNTLVSSTAGNLDGLSTVLNSFFNTACTVAIGAACTVKSQSDCESLHNGDLSSVDTSSLALYFVSVFEQLHTN